jgi:dihydroneopterin aldolase/2-amino-4-hydroxy-6-hydroxymethyldihydropteridine diphosphokinase
MDRVEICGVHVMAVIGVLPHERDAAQPLQLDLVLEGELHDSGHSDELSDTVDYGLVTQQIVALAHSSRDQLLERFAHRVATAALAFPRVAAVEVRVAKLRPPVPQPVQQVAIRIRRSQSAGAVPPRTLHKAVVALGSNLGDRRGYLRMALRELGPVLACSQVYETAPVGGPASAGPYLNLVAVVHTELDPYAFLRFCHRIEAAGGRRRNLPNDPRTLDIDLLFYDDARIHSRELTVPHPRYAERRFVLAPLSEVAPELCPPDWDAQLPPADVFPRGPLGEEPTGSSRP